MRFIVTDVKSEGKPGETIVSGIGDCYLEEFELGKEATINGVTFIVTDTLTVPLVDGCKYVRVAGVLLQVVQQADYLDIPRESVLNFRPFRAEQAGTPPPPRPFGPVPRRVLT